MINVSSSYNYPQTNRKSFPSGVERGLRWLNQWQHHQLLVPYSNRSSTVLLVPQRFVINYGKRREERVKRGLGRFDGYAISEQIWVVHLTREHPATSDLLKQRTRRTRSDLIITHFLSATLFCCCCCYSWLPVVSQWQRGKVFLCSTYGHKFQFQIFINCLRLQEFVLCCSAGAAVIWGTPGM